MRVSSSATSSSKVNPYWNPEQPPPVTNTRSLRAGLPSSSISDLTLVAAASVNTSGAGISVIAFIPDSYGPVGPEPMSQLSRRRERASIEPSALDQTGVPFGSRSFTGGALQFHDRGPFLLGILGADELSLHDRPCMHLERAVRYISVDPCLALQFQIVLGRDRAIH